MKLIMVRHGQTDLNRDRLIQGRSDYPLNNTGIKDIEKAAKILTKNIKHIDFFYSSPSKRAFQSTKILLDAYGYNKTITKNPSFYERNYGPYEGTSVSDFYLIKVHLPGYETNQELEKRVYDGIMNLYKNHRGETVLVGCHSQTIKSILTVFEPKDYTYKSILLNGSIFIFNVTENNIKLIEVLNN